MWILVFPALSYVLFAAHVLYHGYPYAMAISAVMLVSLFFTRLCWVRHGSVLVLILMGLEWAYADWLLVQERLYYGAPWVRAACILGAVALFTWASCAVFFSRRIAGTCTKKNKDEQ